MKPDKLQLTELPRFLSSCQLTKLKYFYFFFLFLIFFLFTGGKLHWLSLVLLFFPSLLPVFQTCQVSNVFLLVWVRVHGVWSKDGLMNTGLQCSCRSSWQAGAWKQSLCTVCSPCQNLCKYVLGSYCGFFLKVKDFFEGVSFYVNKSSNELFNSPNQTLCSSSCSTDLCNFGHHSGHLLQHQMLKVMFAVVQFTWEQYLHRSL